MPQYTIIGLTSSEDGATWANDISASGHVIGYAEISPSRADVYRAYIWFSDSRKARLGTLGGQSSWAYGVNEDGIVVGAAETPDGLPHAALWRHSAIQNLGTLPGYRQSIAYAINSSDQAIGYSYNRLGVDGRCFIHDSGILHALPPLGGRYSRGYGIANNGEVVGWSATANGETHACLWRNGQVADLGTLGGRDSRAYSINSRSQIVGWSDLPSGGRHAVLWSNGQIHDLGSLGEDIGIAYGINSLGQIVGQSDWRAFLFDGMNMVDLNSLIPDDLGWELKQASSINDHGQIAGYGIYIGIARAFMMTPR